MQVPRELAFLLLCGLIFVGYGQGQDDEPGRSIGKISTQGDLVVLELNEGALGKENLFDLTGRTLRFTPVGSGYRVNSGPLHWDSDFGQEVTGAEVALHTFSFPFSGSRWASFSLATTGAIHFGKKNDSRDPYGHPDAGLSIGRFDRLAEAAAALLKSAPAICVFLKPRLFGPHYLKEQPGRAVITWDLSEPFGNLLDFSWFKTTNQFQAVLHSDGTVEMSFKEIAAKDAIVGLYPELPDKPSKIRHPEVHLSSLTPKDGPFPVIYEAFHYVAPPRPKDLSCTVIQALGDKFDFLAYYSDFRVDGQEASSPSDGPVANSVGGIGKIDRLDGRCSAGKFQLGFAQPIYVGANEMQAQPPEGAPLSGHHDITFFLHELAEASADGKPHPYNYAISHLGHEVGHRWGAYISAKVNGETISLGTWPHWAQELQAPVAFPYQLPTEASTLGGSVWQDNFDGTYTRLHDGYFVPATGYSYLDLYLMGLIPAEEVPDFFILKNLVEIRKDSNGRTVFKGDRTKLTIRDVIAAEGQRLPGFDHSQREFNAGIVVVVEHGRKPSRELIERANGIRQQWIEYWSITTGHRATMTVNPH